MPDVFFALSAADRREALEYGRAALGRPAHLLEKDIWVVWVLNALFESSVSSDLTFKGGTSLSKVYRVIDRFSEDIDLTYDIRKLIPDLMPDSVELPSSRSQADKWTKAVRSRLPEWIEREIRPVLEYALEVQGIQARLELAGDAGDKLLVSYPPLAAGTGYVAPVVTLEFGGRSSGEPHQVFEVGCDIAEAIPTVLFPTAAPQVMSAVRTFWEKATAAHVFCAQGRIRGERYARHWHDLIALARSAQEDGYFHDREIAAMVAQHKSFFFVEKDSQGTVIDYMAAVSGGLRVVPDGEARAALESDYQAMVEDEVLVGKALPWGQLLDACAALESELNSRMQPLA